ncbi:DUF5047 domain-containing protein [Streptomyces sp. SID685]|uniref:DUF5047 domain-containing protein n=1 Tax=Streptomyces sp. SID685 TaxID=2690322 RepID=UPI001368A118|nr:DUF5047 domain-containing protein [Streptomyces sp. SID685]MYR84093.1 DUF5047 domain-containing protein [Streptomyces sp. SID685]
MSTTALSVVQGSYTMAIRAESWLAGQLLADGIPIADGTETRDRSLAVPEQISLTIPRRESGYDWDPGLDPAHPLAAFGQQLRIDYGVDIGGGQFEWINRGWFLITDSSCDGTTVTVTCAGLLSLIDEAKLISPFQPSSTDTLGSIIRGLIEPALTVSIDGGLTDRGVPLGMQWDTDRLGAVTEVLNAWGADATVTADGYLYVAPVLDVGAPVQAITDDRDTGTVVQWQGSTSRDGAFNVVVAQGEDSNGNQLQGVAYDGAGDSPYQYGGPFSPFPIPYTYQSSLLTTVAQCRSAAAAQMKLLRRQAFRKLAVSMVPHPGLVAGDYVAVTGAGLTEALAVIETMSLPYSPGEQSLTVRVL